MVTNASKKGLNLPLVSSHFLIAFIAGVAAGVDAFVAFFMVVFMPLAFFINMGFVKKEPKTGDW